MADPLLALPAVRTPGAPGRERQYGAAARLVCGERAGPAAGRDGHRGAGFHSVVPAAAAVRRRRPGAWSRGTTARAGRGPVRVGAHVDPRHLGPRVPLGAAQGDVAATPQRTVGRNVVEPSTRRRRTHAVPLWLRDDGRLAVARAWTGHVQDAGRGIPPVRHRPAGIRRLG